MRVGAGFRRPLILVFATLLLASCGEPKSDQQLFTDSIGDSYGKIVKVAREHLKICNVRFLDFAVVGSKEGAELHANKVLQQARSLTQGTGIGFLSAARRVNVSGKDNDAWIAVVVGCQGKSPGFGGLGGAGQGGAQ